MAANNNDTFPLLDLPPEMVAHIASLTQPCDTFAMRLVNKAVNTAAFSPFAKVYLHDISWCIFGDKNLSDMHNILSHPKLSREVRSISISTSPSIFSVQRISLAMQKHEMSLPATQYKAHLTTADKDANACSMMVPNLPSIKSLMSKAKSLDCELFLTLNSQHLSPAGFVGRIIRDVLALALESHCRIANLELSPRELVRASELTVALEKNRGKGLCSLKRLDLRCDVYNSLNESEKSFEATLPILRAATNLQFLTLLLQGRRIHASTIGNKLLTACRSTNLGFLQLTTMTLDKVTLRKVLKRFRESLTMITLGRIELASDGDDEDAWPEILRTLRTCPRVESLLLYHCTQPWQSVSYTPFDDQRLYIRIENDIRRILPNPARYGHDEVLVGLELWLKVWKVVLL